MISGPKTGRHSARAANLRSALDWIEANPEVTEAHAVLIYAWNESDEGVGSYRRWTKELPAWMRSRSYYRPLKSAEPRGKAVPQGGRADCA